MRRLPCECPSCKVRLMIAELKCVNCQLILKGEYLIPSFAALDEADENFLSAFLKAQGNIKELARQQDISRPTVNKKLNRLLQKLDIEVASAEKVKKENEILDKLEKGEIKFAESLKLLAAL